MLAHLKISKFLTQTNTTSYSSVSSVSLCCTRREGMWVSMNNQVVKDGAFLGQEWYYNFTTQSRPLAAPPIPTTSSIPG